MGCVFLMRIALPDRPGSLGAVASAVGGAGADISAIEIVDKRDGLVVDDFMIHIPPETFPDTIISACHVLPGVRVEWISRYPEGDGLVPDLVTLERMTENPPAAGRILAQAAPAVFHTSWAALISTTSEPKLVEGTDLAPEFTTEQLAALAPFDTVRCLDLPDGWLPDWGETTLAMAPIRGDQAIMIARQGGPAFLSSELARLKHLAALAP